jgi:two-component system sensor histidine kinase KdpD
MLDEADIAAAKWAWQNDRPAGRGSDTLPGARRLFLPMRTGRGAIGVVGIDSDKPGPLLTPDERRLLDALIDQGALAIERVHLVEDMDRVKRNAETDRLRSALLTSISHDLRTPLSSVLGAAGTLRDLGNDLSDAQKADLLATIIDESERLNRFIANLLDMTKLESGAIAPNATLQDLREIVGSALRRARKILTGHPVELEFSPGLPMLLLDAVLFEQALFNLLDNAAKYSAAEAGIRIRAWRDDGTVQLQVSDEGEGIPEGDLERIFDKFYRAQKGDQVRAGTGLGLAISRGFVEAMNGTIDAANRPDGKGAVFTIRLPVPVETARLDTAA